MACLELLCFPANSPSYDCAFVCLSNSLLPSKDRAPASSSGTGEQRGRARTGSGAAAAPALPTGRAPAPAGGLPGSPGRTAGGGCRRWSVHRVPRPPRVTSPGGDCAITRLPGQRAGAQGGGSLIEPYCSSEPFGETLSSLPLPAAPPQNGLFFSGLLT